MWPLENNITNYEKVNSKCNILNFYLLKLSEGNCPLDHTNVEAIMQMCT